MTEPTELMPCPFCGGNARKVKHSAGSPGTIGYDRWHGVACAGCNACVGARDRRFRTSAAAIAAWNTRTPQPTQAQSVAVPLDEARRLFDAGWKAAALFCDREDVVADGIIGFGACPQFEAAFSAAQPVAREPLTDEQTKALMQAHRTAMLMTCKARVPECGEFAAIAQDLDWLCESFGIKGGQHGTE